MSRATVLLLKNSEPSDFRIQASGNDAIVRVINVSDGQIISSESEARIQIIDQDLVPDTSLDVIKISVIERHGKSIGFEK